MRRDDKVFGGPLPDAPTGRNGKSSLLAIFAFASAFTIAGATSGTHGSPNPDGVLPLAMNSITIRGASVMRATVTKSRRQFEPAHRM